MLTCAALVLNHNGRDLLPRLLDSLKAQAGLTAICVIDNASTDDSVSIIRQGYPDVEILINEQNLPFGTAYNRAIAARGEDIIFLANNDIVVHDNAIANALAFLEKNPDVASVSFEGLDPNRADPFPCSCGPLRRFGKELSPGRHFRGPNDPASPSPFYLWGAACCIRRDLFMKVQFDEEMDWDFEDIDLGWAMARQLGARHVFLPNATIFHFESSTSRNKFRSLQLKRMTTRNAILSFVKNGTVWDLLRGAPFILTNLLLLPDRRNLVGKIRQRLRSRRSGVVAARTGLVS